MYGLATSYVEFHNTETDEKIGVVGVLEKNVLYLIVGKYGEFFYEKFPTQNQTEFNEQFNKTAGAKLYNDLDILSDKRKIPQKSLMMNVISEVLQNA